MKKFAIACAICSAFLFSAGAMACSKPDNKPEIPDAATVVTAQMIKANNDVKAYVKAVEDYVKCARLSRADEKREVDDLKAFAEEFNAVVRAFKARAAG